MALNALDRVTIAFAALFSVAVVTRWPGGRPFPVALLFFAAALAGLALLAPRLRARGGVAAFIGDFYALILAVVMYTAIGVLNRAAGVAHDLRVQAWEEALFGAQPSLDWIRSAAWSWLSWPLHLAYLSYYLILAGAPLGLLISGRRREAAAAATLVMCAFYVCYSIFSFFPVAGPRYAFTLARNAATANAAATFTQSLLNATAAWGTAFPSSHVAAALAAGLAAWSAWRPLGAVLLPAAALMTVGTVYGQFHYAVDALAGVLVAAGVWLARARILGAPMQRRSNR